MNNGMAAAARDQPAIHGERDREGEDETENEYEEDLKLVRVAGLAPATFPS